MLDDAFLVMYDAHSYSTREVLILHCSCIQTMRVRYIMLAALLYRRVLSKL